MLWIDVTELIGWRGNFTGIQRVIYSILDNYAEDVRFYKYCKESGFVEVYRSGDSFLDQKSNKPDLVTTNIALDFLKKPLVKIARRAFLLTKHFARFSLNLLSPKLKQFCYTKYHDLRHHTEEIAPPKTNPFGNNDSIFIAGCFWGFPEMYSSLRLLKKEKNIKVHFLVYDMIAYLFPQFFPEGLAQYYGSQVKAISLFADSIITISKNSKKDIEQTLRELHGRTDIPIHVIRLGDHVSNRKEYVPHSLSDKKFILSVGTVEVRKNYMLLYMAWKYMLRNFPREHVPILAIVGRPGWLTADLQYFLNRDPDVKDHILWLKDANDVLLESLYKDCLFTIYPSLYEGWGLPVGESLCHNKFCITSNNSSLIEIADRLVDYIDPFSPEDCARKIMFYLDDKHLSAANERIQRYAPAKWSDTASSLHQIINNNALA